MSYLSIKKEVICCCNDRKETADVETTTEATLQWNQDANNRKEIFIFLHRKSTYSPRLVSQKMEAEKERRKQSSGETSGIFKWFN